MPEIDIVALDVDIKQLADVFLLLVAIQIARLEFLSDIGQLLVHALFFQFACAGVAQVCDELN